ncbi:2-hydroxyglutaryl-CoA dehydratase, D-component [Sporotomaculum syntrophicum]|uniref:2-hydroxyglutaryl-CoA dehydratase, D-component n=1 Tax=Sporotomaculum syntrophicum TaxID=182264 RepID=A0A9D2WSV2_9FIRM|nr:CoA protein activase [Sporotomaculum syntrophicum]KAF1086495.1 2-hydroxyglutaryl-CoA dehydratase, D-component [Sporotomaculum syntrophicum]
MKVVYPHMGLMWICIKAMLEYLNVDVIVPPPSSKKTLLLGVKHAPEFACMPLKLNLGNFMEAAELGADTIVMAGGCGPCRFGYYAHVEHAILRDLGYQYELVVLEPPQKHIGDLLDKIKQITGQQSWRRVINGIRFGYHKAEAVDKLERMANYCRPRETTAGATDRALQHALQEIINVAAPEGLPAALQRAVEIMDAIPVDIHRPVLRIGLVGEIYTLLEPFANQDIERKLGSMGVEVDRSIYLSEWVNEHLFLGLAKNTRSSKLVKQKAIKYLRHFVGGHGLETVGSTVFYAEQGYDGVIQLLPFTCMPEIVAQSILPRVSAELGIPAMTLIVDEQSGEAGLVTRLEAFVDLLARRKQTEEALA